MEWTPIDIPIPGETTVLLRIVPPSPTRRKFLVRDAYHTAHGMFSENLSYVGEITHWCPMPELPKWESEHSFLLIFSDKCGGITTETRSASEVQLFPFHQDLVTKVGQWVTEAEPGSKLDVSLTGQSMLLRCIRSES